MKITTIFSAVCGVGALFLITFGAWTISKPQLKTLPAEQALQSSPTPQPSAPEVMDIPSVAAVAPPDPSSLDTPPLQAQVSYNDHQTDELVKEYLRQRYALTKLQLDPPSPTIVQQNPSALLGYLNQTASTIDAARKASDAASARMNATQRAQFEAQKKSIDQQQ